MDKKETCPCEDKDFSNAEECFAFFDEDTDILIVCDDNGVRTIKCEGKKWKKEN